MKLWQTKNILNKEVEKYTVSNDYILDKKLVKYDCIASISHAKMLCNAGYLKKGEAEKLIKKLNKIIRLSANGKFEIKREDEDCHTAIENYLGKLGKKIHFARSRNDQVLTALRLYEKAEINKIREEICKLSENIKKFSSKYGNIQFPGYTHTRKAMPSSIALWLDSFVESLKDNIGYLEFCHALIDQNPLGTGAGYGLPIKIDRECTTRLLNFKKTQENPVYAQNSRGKFEFIILNALSAIMLDLNKISNDIILFSMPEIGYLELDKKICTGSSIMPHKKNPDVLELIRANYHIVNSYEFRVKEIIGNLISGYNRDLQLTKEPIIRGFDITKESLSIMKIVFENLKVNKEKCENAMTDEIYSVRKVYELSKKKSFRDAYKKISKEY
jgi:argininosuccinate lyase